MARLEQMLNDGTWGTLLGTLAPDAYVSWAPDLSQLDLPAGHTWSWLLDHDDGPRARNVSYGNSLVCDVVRWHDLAATVNGVSYALPLSWEFLVGVQSAVDRAPVAGSTLWPLPLGLDLGVQFIYGYEFLPGAQRPTALPEPTRNSVYDYREFGQAPPWFMPAGKNVKPIAEISADTAAIIDVTPPRVLVAVSLVGCKPNTEFEPVGVLKAARLFPLVMIRASVPLRNVEAAITLRRPATSEMTSSPMSAALLADHNVGVPPVPPTWDKLFAYYDTQPAGRYPIVRPAPPPPGRSRDESGIRRIFPPQSLTDQLLYPPTVTKVDYQGAYDNIHLAPRLRLPLVNATVTMAPFCVHDCLHTHWRWGTGYSAKHVQGWDAQRPYAKVGAPQVPPGHAVSLEIIDAQGFTYRDVIADVPADRWEPVFHHGSAYAVELRDIVAVVGQLFLDSLPVSFDVNNQQFWASMYYYLRMDPTTLFPIGIERVQLKDGDVGRKTLEALGGP